MNFLTFAQNSSTIDYLKLAYVQAMSIKLTMPNSKYAVIVDNSTFALVEDKHRLVFDYIIEMPVDYSAGTNAFLNEWQAYELSPFEETIKLESDILFPMSIEHWLPTLRQRDIVLSLHTRDFLGNFSYNRAYRKTFDESYLPDVYNGLMYFRRSQVAESFFNTARDIFLNWSSASTELILSTEEYATTDVVYAMAANIIGVENCTIPSADFINFTHMKPKINRFPEETWDKLVTLELDLPMIRIANKNQYKPVHYYFKDIITDRIVKEYEDAIRK